MTKAIAVRLVADAVMMAAAFLMGLTWQLVWFVPAEGSVMMSRPLLADFLRSYLTGTFCLLPIGLSAFIVSGIYTRVRAYRLREKGLVIARAVSLTYLFFGALALVFPGVITIPRGSLLLAWLFTLAFTTAARIWAALWISLLRIEHRLDDADPADGTIRNVLVIGGAGYIGSALLPKLLNKGYHVRLLDLLLFGAEPIATIANHPHLEIVRADFRQMDKVVDAMRAMDAVIHLGAIVGDPACALDEELTIEVNLMATRMIAQVAKGSGVNRFVFASTCSVYGASDELLDEHSALNPVSLYARSKIASERVLREMADNGFSPIIVRFGTIYGLSGRARFDLVVNLLAAKAVVGGQITVFGGDQWRPFVHVDDAALALVKVLEAPEALVHGQIFNVGSDEQNYTIQQVGELVHRMVPTAELISARTDSDRRNYRVNFGKIRKVLGFAPRWTMEQGVQQVIDAIKAGTVKNYQDAKFSNVKYLSDPSTSLSIRHEKDWAHKLISDPFLLIGASPKGQDATATRVEPDLSVGALVEASQGPQPIESA